MIHQQRFLNSKDWKLYDNIMVPMKALTKGFQPEELCAKPFVSLPLVNPSVMIIGYNPGGKGSNSIIWNDARNLL